LSLVDAPVNLGQFFRDVVQSFQISPSAVPGLFRLPRAVHPPLDHRNLCRAFGLDACLLFDG
jgi:hypothetical protein